MNTGSSLSIFPGAAVSANNDAFTNGTNTILQYGGTNSANFFYLGSNPGAVGTYNQTGGVNSQASLSIGDYPSGFGNYLLGGGQLIASGNIYNGAASNPVGVGTITITGGSAQVAGILFNYNVAGNFVNVSGGSLTVGFLDTAAPFYLQSGSLSVGSIFNENNPANFHFTGGALTLTNSILNLQPGGPQLGSSLTIGSSQSLTIANNNGENVGGTLIQTGGSNYITGNLAVGISGGPGAYALSGAGLLTVNGSETIGSFSTGMFNQSGGTNTSPILIVAPQFSPSGTYTLSGGNLNLSTGEYVGQGGNGTFMQTGGVQTIGELGIGTTVAGFGRVSITNGTTNVGGSVGVGGTPTTPGGQAQLTVGAGGLLVTSTTGTLTVFDNPANQLVVNSGGNISAGAITLLGGVASISANGQLHTSGPLTFSGTDVPLLAVVSDNTLPGVLYLNSSSGVIANGSSGIAYISSVNSATLPGLIDLGGGPCTFNISAGSAPVEMVISATLTHGSLVKTGAGILQLAGSDAFIGATYPAINVSAGTLQLGSSASSTGFSYALGGAGTTTFINSGGNARSKWLECKCRVAGHQWNGFGQQWSADQ